jgi:hypothetical protein
MHLPHLLSAFILVRVLFWKVGVCSVLLPGVKDSLFGVSLTAAEGAVDSFPISLAFPISLNLKDNTALVALPCLCTRVKLTAGVVAVELEEFLAPGRDDRYDYDFNGHEIKDAGKETVGSYFFIFSYHRVERGLDVG